MPTASFMGEVTVPLFQSPLSVTSNSAGVPFNFRSAAPTSTTTYISTVLGGTSNNYRQPRGALVFQFLTTGILTRQAGNTNAPGANESLSTNNFAMSGNSLFVGSFFNKNIFGTGPTVFGTTYNFGASTTIPQAPASAIIGTPGAFYTGDLGGLGECVISIAGIYIRGTIQFLSDGSGTPYMVAECPLLNLSNPFTVPSPLANLSIISPPINSTEFFYPICFPDFNTGITHCYFQKNSGTAIRYLAFKTFSTLTGMMTYQIVGNEYLTFDNAALNNRITTGGGQTRFSYNGFLFSTSNATDPTGVASDYLVAFNGLKYWRLRYISQIPGVVPNQQLAGYTGGGQDGTATNLYIDAAGIVWYAGTPTVSGGISRPWYSFGVNVNFHPIGLPAVPPFKLPCWSPCLGGDSPLANIPEF